MSANCNGGIVNIPQVFNGQNGISSYVYIAYADNVVPGSPDTVTNFQYGQPDPTSEWIAIITTNTPINNPGVLDFEDQWVKIKGTSGVGAAGINVENNNVAVTGGPFTTLNFFAAGLTGVTVSNAGGSQADIEIVTAGLNKRYFSDFINDIGNLIPGASYWIVDIGDGEQNTNNSLLSDCSAAYYAQTYPSAGFDNYAHNAGIILRAITDDTVDSTGIYLARVPSRSMPLFTPGTSYTTGNYVENYNEVFELIGSSGSYTVDPANDPTNWTFIYKDDTTYYDLEINGCEFDVNIGIIKKRWDNRGNILTNTNSIVISPGSQTTANELIKKAFRWGLSDYTSNKITFHDNILKSNTFRAPDYTSTLYIGGYQNSLVNYSTIGQFSNNVIDSHSAYNLDNAGDRTSGTRFFNVQLQNSAFANNNIENCVITNISDSLFGLTEFLNNTIKDSVINKFHYSRFRYNDISQFTVLGDIYYYVGTDEGTTQSSAKTLCSSVTYAPDSTTSGIWNQAILNNLGSKSYVPGLVAGNGTSTATNSGANTLIQLNDAGTLDEHASQLGDIVYFITSPTVNLTSTFKPINTVPPSTTSFTVSGNITSSPSTGAFTLHIFHPSIDTSLENVNKNILVNTVVRGVNKNNSAPSTYFNKNDIRYTVIDNYEQHTLDKNSVYTSYCDFLGAVEFGGGSSNAGGFSGNAITNSYFYANYITNNFTNNKIENAYFLNNGNTGSGGLTGTFSNNSLLGVPTDIKTKDFPFTPITQTLFNPTVFFSGNNFNTTSQFYNNTIREYNSVTSCVLNAGSSFLSSSLEGRNLPTITPSAFYTSFTGLSSVTLNTNVRIIGITLKGRNAKLTGVTFGSNNNKEVNYVTADNGTAVFFNRFTLENFEVNPAFSTGTYGSDALIPALFGDSVNMIRNISAISEGAAVAYTPGGITYQTTTFTFNVTTQMPHMINATGGIYSVGTEGLSTRVVSLTNYSTGAPAPGGAYFTFGSSNAVKLTGTITAIVDAYTLTFTASQTTAGDRLLHSTNAVVDSIGNPAPGIGLLGPYNDGGRDFIDFPYWFENIGNVQNLNSGNATYQRSLITPTYSELTTRIALGLPGGAPPAPPSGSRNYYVFYNYTAATTVLYNLGTLTLTLPKYFELMGGTVIFGSHTAGTYQISTITNMPEGIPIRFVTTVGCAVQFNLVATSALASNRIVQDSAATTYTIQTYLNSSQYAYDEIVLMKQNGVIRIVNKIIHV